MIPKRPSERRQDRDHLSEGYLSSSSFAILPKVERLIPSNFAVCERFCLRAYLLLSCRLA